MDHLRLNSPTTMLGLAFVVLLIAGIAWGWGAMLQAALLVAFCFGVYAIVRLLLT